MVHAYDMGNAIQLMPLAQSKSCTIICMVHTN